LGLPQLGPLDKVKVLSGFPPSPLDIEDREKSIASVGVKSGDTLILQVTPVQVTSSEKVFGTREPEDRSDKEVNKRLKTEQKPAEVAVAPGDDKLLRKVVPADNSCLFTSINYCMSGQVVDSSHSSFMREIIASVVSSDPVKYCEAFLGRTNSSYCTWIQGKDAWGGAIEVQILAEYFQVEIAVVDTVSGSLTIFGEGLNFPSRMVLIYDGIHYDPLHLPSGQSVHSTSDNKILEAAKATAAEAKAAHNYTDTAGFTLKCLVCGQRLTGEKEAQQHAKSTKHSNFSEV